MPEVLQYFIDAGLNLNEVITDDVCFTTDTLKIINELENSSFHLNHWEVFVEEEAFDADRDISEFWNLGDIVTDRILYKDNSKIITTMKGYTVFETILMTIIEKYHSFNKPDNFRNYEEELQKILQKCIDRCDCIGNSSVVEILFEGTHAYHVRGWLIDTLNDRLNTAELLKLINVGPIRHDTNESITAQNMKYHSKYLQQIEKHKAASIIQKAFLHHYYKPGNSGAEKAKSNFETCS